MNDALSVAERAIWAVDSLINRAVTYAWMSSLRHQREFGERGGRLQPTGEEEMRPSKPPHQPLD